MTDIVTLGLALDARPIAAGVKALDDLTAAARPAAAAASSLEKAIKPAADAVASLGNTSNTRGLDKITAGVKALAAASAPAVAALSKLQQQINSVTGVNSSNTGLGRADDVAAYGMELDNVRAKYNPLFAAQQNYKTQLAGINAAAKSGAITESERAAAITDTKVAFVQQVNSIRGASEAYDALNKSATPATKAASNGAKDVAKSTSLARYELINLSRQFQDVGVSLASGQSPLMVAVQQGAQIADVFASSTGTVGGFVKQVASGLMTILTPARLVVGGLAGIAAIGISAGSSWSGAQKQITLGLMGIGRASGVTAGQINEIADATSSLGGLSVSEARETATALASTGKIGVDNVKLLTANTKNFAAILGTDVPKAAEAMATIFANPTEGAKQLAIRIGGIDAVTLKLIETQEQSGDRQSAIKTLIEATIPAIAKASDQTGTWSKMWTGLGNTASNAYTAIGKATASTADQKTTEQLEAQRDSLQKLIAQTQELAKTDTGSQKLFDVASLKDYNSQLAAVNTALDRAAAAKSAALGVGAAQTSLQVAPIVNALAPAPEIIRQVTANLTLMNSVMADPAQTDFIQRMGTAFPQALERLKNQQAALTANPRLADPISSSIDSLTLQNKLLNSNTPAMRQRVEYQLAYNDAVKQGASAEEASSIARLRGQQASGGPAAYIQQQQQYISLLGSTATAEQAVLAIQLQRKAAAIQGITITDAQQAALEKLAREQSTGVAAIKANTDAMNVDIATVGMGAGATAAYTAEQNALNAAKQQGRTLSADSIAQIKSEAAALGAAAQQADLMKAAYTGLVQGPLQTLVSSISSGSTFFDALKKSGVSALTSIASKLADIAAQNLWASAFGGSSGGGLMSLLGLGGSGSAAQSASAATLANGTGGAFYGPGFATGGYTGSGGKHQPAGIVHKGEYVIDAANTRRIGVGNLNRLRGYAEGGVVGGLSALTSPARAGNDNGAGGGVSVPINVNIDATGADAAGLARVQQSIDQLKADLPARVVAAVLDGRKKRQI